eukprot:scaffold5294_cov67-Phaeocystis_antarctica.AAC.1
MDSYTSRFSPPRRRPARRGARWLRSAGAAPRPAGKVRSALRAARRRARPTAGLQSRGRPGQSGTAWYGLVQSECACAAWR